MCPATAVLFGSCNATADTVAHWTDLLPSSPVVWGSDPTIPNMLVFISTLSKTSGCFEISRLLDMHFQLKRAHFSKRMPVVVSEPNCSLVNRKYY